MEVEWNGRRFDAPAWAPAPGAVLIHTEVALPLARLSDRHGGWVVDPTARKVLTFAVVDGPWRTVRKVRGKLAQRGYLGDWHVTLVLGRRADDGVRVVALAPHAPLWAQAFLAPSELVARVGERCSEGELRSLGEALARDVGPLDGIAHERYLYSGNTPPGEVVDAFATLAARHCAPSGRQRIAPPVRPKPLRTLMPVRAPRRAALGPPLALLGCGDYAATELLPSMLEHAAAADPYVVADREPHLAVRAAREHGFGLCTTDADEAIDVLPGAGVVMVATAHDSHARLAARAARAGHAAFTEKPAVITHEDLDDLVDAFISHPGRIEVGFNRRHAPMTATIRGLLDGVPGPTTVTSIVKEIPLRPTHWFMWPNQGTRIAGNLCHWLDLATHLIADDAEPVELSVSPWVGGDIAARSAEERTITVTFDDGSVTTIVATTRGDATRGVQERIDVRRGGVALTCEDYRVLRSLIRGRSKIEHLHAFRDKGHTGIYRSWARRLRQARPARYPLRDLVVVSTLQLAATELVLTGGVRVDVVERLEPYREVLGRPRRRAPAAVRVRA